MPPDSYWQDADDAAALMRSLGHESYSLIGWSDGAISAVLLAASQPQAVRNQPLWRATLTRIRTFT